MGQSLIACPSSDGSKKKTAVIVCGLLDARQRSEVLRIAQNDGCTKDDLFAVAREEVAE
jgi:hypothetical protein